MGANYSKLDDSISTAAYDDQELKDMLHDIIANDTKSFESVINQSYKKHKII
jgi:formiminotetrahydrofolate cyclodeaminase